MQPDKSRLIKIDYCIPLSNLNVAFQSVSLEFLFQENHFMQMLLASYHIYAVNLWT